MNLFNHQNPIHILLNKLGDIIIANLLFIIFALPIVTIGPALTALYHCMLRSVKGTGESTVKTFWHAFRDNFKQSFFISLVLALLAIILIINLRFWELQTAAFAKVIYNLAFVLLLMVVGLAMYIFPVIATFHNTTRNLLKNAAIFALTHLPITALTIVITCFPMVMTFRDLTLFPLYIFCWFFFGFGLIAYINAYLYYQIFKLHM